MKLDRVHKESGKNTLEITNNGSCIPFGEHSKILFIVRGKNCILRYDIVSFDLKQLSNINFFCKQQQYLGEERCNIGKTIVRINFNHPIEELFVVTDKKIENLKLQIVDKPHNFSFTQIDELKWKLVFVDEKNVTDDKRKTLNFSMIKSSYVLFNNNFDNNIIRIFADTHAVICYSNGMTGLRFSK